VSASGADDGYDGAALARYVDEPSKRAARGPFQRDRARVLHSAGLRRLAATTQVVTAGQADFARTRLTHSLEVAQVGRELGDALGADPDLVEVACLAHDLGHPPFGHNGEAALDSLAADAGGFEGNAQTLRVLTRLEAKTFTAGRGARSVGLNLTRASLDATVKYPWQRPAGGGKFGVYAADLLLFDWVREDSPAAPDASPRRCLEAQVMDWADDIAYCVHDLEDAVHAGYLQLADLDDASHRASVAAVAVARYCPQATGEQVLAALDRLRAEPFWPTRFRATRADLAALKNCTSQLIGRLAGAAEQATRSRAGQGRLTRYGADLVVPAPAVVECAALKAVAAHFVMDRAGAADRYAAQRELIADLVAALAAGAPDSLSPPLREDYAAAAGADQRLRVVVDQVAALTDVSALRTHAHLTGSAALGEAATGGGQPGGPTLGGA